MLTQIQASLAQIRAGTPSDIAPQGLSAGAPSFTQHMGDLIRSVDNQGHAAQDAMLAVERGSSDDLVGAMLKSQQASLSFQMMMQVRNKVVTAVDDLIKLQL